MQRRLFLGLAGVSAVFPLAGCLGDSRRDEPEPSDSDSNGEYDVLDYSNPDVSVPLIGTAEAASWHADDAGTVFVDARSADEFRDHRITDAIHSQAPSGNDADDPVESLSTDTRLVTYCVCPHSLAGQRAASLIDAGYSSVYALDKGLQHWIDEGHPVEGDEVTPNMSGTDVPVLEYH